MLSYLQVVHDSSLEGDITVPGAPAEDDDQEFNTLDEPVKDTVVSELAPRLVPWIVGIISRGSFYLHAMV